MSFWNTRKEKGGTHGTPPRGLSVARIFLFLSLVLFPLSFLQAETRIKTVEYNMGGYYSSANLTAGVKGSTNTENVRLPESGVTIVSAWIEYEGVAVGAATPAALTLYFDSGNTASTSRLAVASATRAAATQVYNLFARADVTQVLVAQAASLPLAGGVNFSAAVSMTNCASNTHSMKLYVTYSYDDTSATQVKTVRFPLFSNYTSSQAAYGQQKLLGTTTMQYLVDIRDTGMVVKSQWFEIRGFRQANASTTNGTIRLQIGANALEPVMTLVGANTNSYDFRYLSSSTIVPGFSTGTLQTVNLVTTQSPMNTLGGEVVVTYESNAISAVHTQTVRKLLGQSVTTAANGVFTDTIKLPETGAAIKNIYAKITGSYNSTTAGNLAVASSIGGVAVTAKTYMLQSQATQTSGYQFFHDMSQAISGWTNGAIVTSTITYATSGGGYGMELIITYHYTDDSTHNSNYTVLAGSGTVGNTTASGHIASVYYTEGGGSKTLREAYVYGNYLSNLAVASPSTLMSFNGNSTATVTNVTAANSSRLNWYYSNTTQFNAALSTATAAINYSSTRAGYFGGQLTISYLFVPHPKLPDSLAQINGGNNLSFGTAFHDRNFTFQGLCSSSMTADSLALVVEIKPNAVAFNGVGLTTGSFTGYAGTPLSLTVSSNSIIPGLYHWRAAVLGNGNLGDWKAFGGSPDFSVSSDVFVNEVFPTGLGQANDWIELYNKTTSTYTLTGWTLVYDDGSLAVPGIQSGVWTGGASDKINALSTFTVVPSNDLGQGYLMLKDAAGFTVDEVQWPALNSGQSFARIKDGDTTYLEVDGSPSEGFPNYVSTSTLKINEVAYGSLSSQFIELYNNSRVSTITLAGYYLRNFNGVPFRFSRIIYPLNYTAIDYSSVSDDGLTYAAAFGPTGLNAAGDFLALANSTGTTLDKLTWESGTNYSRYDYTAQPISIKDFAPANQSFSIGRSTDGVDTDDNSVDFRAMSFTTLVSSNNKAALASANTWTYPIEGQVLPRNFQVTIQFGVAASSGAANNLVFQCTSSDTLHPDINSPHIFRLQDEGFILNKLTAQTTVYSGALFTDQDGHMLVDSATYRVTLNTQGAINTAPQLVRGTVTYDASIHGVTGTDASFIYMNNNTRADSIKLQISNNSPAGFNTLEVSTVNFTVLNSTSGAFNTTQAQRVFNAIMLIADSTSGVVGQYESGIDVSTVAYIPKASISLSATGFSTLTVTASLLSSASIVAASTQTFFLVFEATKNASGWTPYNTFRVKLNPATDVDIRDARMDVYESFTAAAQVTTASTTIIAPATPITGSTWPYITPSSASVSAAVGTYGGAILASSRTYIASTDGNLYAVTSSGTLIWNFLTHPVSPIKTNPDVETEGGSVYIYFATQNGDAYKLQDTGSSYLETWTPSPIQLTDSISSVMGSMDKIYLGSSGTNHRLYCIYKSTGGFCTGWNSDLAITDKISGVPSIDDRTGVNSAWIGLQDGNVVNLNTGDGVSGLSFLTGGAVTSSPFVDPWTGTLYVASTDHKLYARTSKLGGNPPGWSVGFFDAGAAIHTSPFIMSLSDIPGHIFFGDDNGNLHKVSTTTADETSSGWPFHAGGAIQSSPIFVPYDYPTDNVLLQTGVDYVYFGCDDGYIYAVNANTGALRTGWPVATGGAVRSDPVVDADNMTLVIGSNDGRVYRIYIGP